MPKKRPFKSGFCYGYIGGRRLASGLGKYRLVEPVIDQTDIERMKHWLKKAKQKSTTKVEDSVFDDLIGMCDGTDVDVVNVEIQAEYKKMDDLHKNGVVWLQQ
jgi:hypothetical protein